MHDFIKSEVKNQRKSLGQFRKSDIFFVVYSIQKLQVVGGIDKTIDFIFFITKKTQDFNI